MTKISVFIILFTSLLIYKYYSTSQIPPIKSEQVDKWKIQLTPVSFSGIVRGIVFPRNKDHLSRTAVISLKDTANFRIPTNCEYFRLEKGNLLFTIDNINISTGPDHKIEQGDLIVKNKDSDTISIYKRPGCCKFFFPIFDGLGTQKTQMKITAQPICN